MENMCDMAFEKERGCGGTANRMSDYVETKRKHLCQSISFDNVRRCRSATSLKTGVQCRCFIVNFKKFVKIVLKKEMAKETLDYHTEISGYQFEPEISFIKKGSPGKRTGFGCVLQEGVWNKVR